MSSSTAAEGPVASARRIATIASLTVREASRRRLLLALIGLTVAAVLFTAWGFSQLRSFRVRGSGVDREELELVASQLLILVMFMFSFVVALTSVFVSAPAIAGELESGQALAMLARPLARWELLLGRWLGLCLLVTLYAVGVSGLQFAATRLTTGYLPPDPLPAALYLAGQAVVIVTLSLVLSTRFSSVTGGIVGLLLFAIAWVGGIVGGIGRAFGDGLVERVGAVTALLLPSDGLWRGTINALEPAAVRQGIAVAGQAAAAFPFYAPFPPATEFLLYAGGWVLVMLVAGALSLERREV